ncbi:MAG: hypothetical protein AB1758_15500, partial [Candidatus Eremiobacterota bacterium]
MAIDADAASVAGRYFAQRLTEWAQLGNLRDYPWRHTRNPYVLLLTEMMLRRTRSDNVVPVFRRFFARWPTVCSFREAPCLEVRQVLDPLGLRWRIQNILDLRDALDGEDFSFERVLRLPGVGDYVASATACFARDEPRPLIDTNLVRVLGRYFGFPVGPETRRRKGLRDLASALVPAEDPRTYNY